MLQVYDGCCLSFKNFGLTLKTFKKPLKKMLKFFMPPHNNFYMHMSGAKQFLKIQVISFLGGYFFTIFFMKLRDAFTTSHYFVFVKRMKTSKTLVIF